MGIRLPVDYHLVCSRWKNYFTVNGTVLSIFSTKALIFSLILALHFPVLADKNNNTSIGSSVSWTAASSWDEGSAPSVTNIGGEDITINGYVTVAAADITGAGGTMTFAGGNPFAMKVAGVLVIEGDVLVGDGAMDILVEADGILIVLGDFTTNDEIKVDAKGTLVVTGDMTFGGTNSDFITQAETELYVGGTVSGNANAESIDEPLANVTDPFILNIISGSLADITVSAISGNTREDGTTATFTVVLDSEPTNDVTIGISSDNTNEGTVSPSSLTFTNVNWDTPQTVTVTGVDDAIDDDNQVFNIVTAAATSADVNYNTLNAEDVSVTNEDDDTAGISVSTITGNTREDGTTATFTVVLDSEPTSDVTIGISSDNTDEGTVSLTSLTFTNVNWDSPQSVTVTGVDDAIGDGNQVFNIVTAAASSGDGNYDLLNPADVVVSNEDDDTPGITVSPLSVTVQESGTQETFTIVLDSEPTDDVTISIMSDDTGEATVDQSSLTFTSVNWNSPQTVTVTGVSDGIDDDDATITILTGTASSPGDSNYDGLDPDDVSVTNVDIDVSGISISAISGNTREDGTAATFTVVLDSEPTNDVTIGISSDNTNEGTVLPASLTFTNLNWDTPQTVTVTGVDDAVDDGNQVFNIVTAAATSADANYNSVNAVDVSVTNEDDDTAGITVSAITGNTREDGTAATFTVVLDSEPTNDVTIGISSDNTNEGTVLPASLTFTNLNWSTAQTVTVTGVDDAVDDGNVAFNIITAAATSGDANYNTLNAADVPVTNEDDDTAGITVSAITGNTREDGTTATFTVVLDSEPTNDVTIGISSDNANEGTVLPASLPFTNLNWATPQTVTVTGVDDAVDDGNQAYTIITEAAASGDANYNTLNAADVSVTNEDDDTAGITVSAITGNTREDGTTATFTVVLDSEPTNDVTIGIGSDNTNEGTVLPTSLTFTNLNWSTAQTVTVTGVDDAVDDGNQAYTIITAAATSGDANYNTVNAADVSVTNEDDDTAGITVSAITDNTREDGTTATFTVVLDSEPTNDVSIGLSSDNTNEGTVSPTSLTFTNLNWNTPQTVTVTGVDDAVVDGDQVFNISTASAVSADPNYNALNATDVTVTNEDDDVAAPGITVSTISGNTREDGAAATFTVVLDDAPTASVSIGLSSDDEGEGVVSPASISFTATDWNVPQTITVSGVDDAIVDGNSSFTILLSSAVSSDPNYSGLDPNDVMVTNEDDDMAGVTVSDSNVTTDESGASTTFSVVLNAQPTADVSIGIRSDNPNEGTVSPSSLQFTSQNWSVQQEVTVTGVDDQVDDGNTAYTIQLETVVSADPAFNGLDPSDVNVSNQDDDMAGFLVSSISNETDEEGTPATFTVSLASQPTEPVNIQVSSGNPNQGTVTPNELMFTTTSWNLAQTVTVTGVEDDEVDGEQTITIVLAPASSQDPTYDGLDPADVLAIVIDNDIENEAIQVAKAFSPNGDGRNDEWLIPGIESYPVNKVMIFNRWGTKIFEVDGYDNAGNVWRGEVNTGGGDSNEATFSTYYYVIDLNNGSKPISGSVLLSR